MNKLTKVFALLLVVALASTTFYVGTQLNSTVSTLGDEQNVSPVDLESSLEFDPLHVSLNGESKLHVNESSVYEAVVSGGSGNFGYLWSVDPVDEKVVFEYSGGTCGFMFVVATVDPYTLTVEVTDLVSGNKAFDSFTVYDPYTLPDLYLEASLADFVCRVKSDGAGWYFVSDGESGKTLFSSTVLFDAIDYALASTTSGNVLLDGVYFDYSLDIPVGVSVIECVDGLTRVFVNAANSQGSPYTVSVDTVNPTYYLAQDSAGRFVNSWSSLDYAILINSVLNALPTINMSIYSAGYQMGHTGSIHTVSGVYHAYSEIQQPQYSDITMTGEGTAMQYPSYGMGGGTQIISHSKDGCFRNYAGCNLQMRNIEFIQAVDCGTGNFSMQLSGYNHLLDNVNVVNYPQISGITFMECGGISFGGGWGNDKSLYSYVAISGFKGGSQIYSAHGTWDTCTFGRGGGLGIDTGYRQSFINLHISGVQYGDALRIRGNMSLFMDALCIGGCIVPTGSHKISFETGEQAKLEIGRVYNLGDYTTGAENVTNANFCNDWSRLTFGELYDEVLKQTYSTHTPALHVLPTVQNNATAVTDLAKITDGNYTTSCSTITKTVGSAVEAFSVSIDLGRVCTVDLSAKVGLWSDTGTVNGYWQYSTDGITYIGISSDRCVTRAGTTESIKGTAVEGVTAQYVRFALSSSAAMTLNANIYEITVIDVLH